MWKVLQPRSDTGLMRSSSSEADAILHLLHAVYFIVCQYMQLKRAERPVVRPPQYAPAPASDDLNSHPELSPWKSLHMAVMQGVMFHYVCK